MARCEDCIHYGVCAELERFRDPLWFINTKDEFCCSSYLPADVAPRAEVANKIFCEIEEEIVAALKSNYRARKEHIERYAELAYDTELLLEINGKINALRGIEAFVEELKKKYTEGRK